MNTIVIGDLHGKADILNELLEDENQGIVCIGDYLDSFDRSYSDQIETLETVLWCARNRKDFYALWGNHDLGYIDYNQYGCSGWSWLIQNYVNDHDLKAAMNESLLVSLQVGDFLLTHAGVSDSWLPEDVDRTMDAVIDYVEECDWNKIAEVGYSRGGKNPCGGPLWCDNWDEFVPIKGLKQVFGHSARRPSSEKPGIVVDEWGNWNIDCLDREREVLEITNQYAAIRKF